MTTGYGTVFWSWGAEVMDSEAWKSTVNSEAGVAATDYWGKLMKFAPEGVSGFTWYEAMQAFMSGSVAMFIDADHMAGQLRGSGAVQSRWQGWLRHPAGGAGRHPHQHLDLVAGSGLRGRRRRRCLAVHAVGDQQGDPDLLGNEEQHQPDPQISGDRSRGPRVHGGLG